MSLKKRRRTKRTIASIQQLAKWARLRKLAQVQAAQLRRSA